MSWRVQGPPPVHVYPLNDLREHETAGAQCPCMPTPLDDGMVIVHNSFDGREILERARVSAFVDGRN